MKKSVSFEFLIWKTKAGNVCLSTHPVANSFYCTHLYLFLLLVSGFILVIKVLDFGVSFFLFLPLLSQFLPPATHKKMSGVDLSPLALHGVNNDTSVSPQFDAFPTQKRMFGACSGGAVMCVALSFSVSTIMAK